MNILMDDHRQLLLSLLNNNVSFILIGGYAVIYYGYGRITGDMDIWLQPDNENRNKLLNALKDFGVEESDLEKLEKTDFTVPQVFYIGAKPRRIDFLTKVSGISFSEAISQVNYFGLQDKQVPVIHYHHLILTKITTGRAKDKADIEELERINKYRKWK